MTELEIVQIMFVSSFHPHRFLWRKVIHACCTYIWSAKIGSAQSRSNTQLYRTRAVDEIGSTYRIFDRGTIVDDGFNCRWSVLVSGFIRSLCKGLKEIQWSERERNQRSVVIVNDTRLSLGFWKRGKAKATAIIESRRTPSVNSICLQSSRVSLFNLLDEICRSLCLNMFDRSQNGPHIDRARHTIENLITSFYGEYAFARTREDDKKQKATDK